MEVVLLNSFQQNNTTNDIIPIINNVLFVNSGVTLLRDYTNPETFAIEYNDQTSTRDEMMQCFLSASDNNNINRIGFAFHYSELNDPNTILFLNQEPFFTEADLGEPVDNIFSPNVQFMLDLLLHGGIAHVDFLACNTLQNDKWKRYYQLLQTKTGVIIGASDNNTGNLLYGGDWIMESTHEEVGLIYFTTGIENYVDLLFDAVLPNSYGYAYLSYGRPCFCIGGDFMYSMNVDGSIRRTNLINNSMIADYYTGGTASMSLFYYNGYIYARNGSYDVCKIDVNGNTGVLINALFIDTGWMADPSLFCSDGTFLYCSTSGVDGTGYISRAYLGSAAASTTAPGGAAKFISNLTWNRQPCIVGEFMYVPIYGDNKIKKYRLSTGVLVDDDLTKGVALPKLACMVYYDFYFYVSQSYVYVGGQPKSGNHYTSKSIVPHGIWKIGLNGSVEVFFSDLMTVSGASWYADYTELAVYNDKLYCLEYNSTNIIAINLSSKNYYNHTFYTLNATRPTVLTRTIYNNTGTMVLDISFGGMPIADVFSLMDCGGTNPFTIGIVDSYLNKICMDIALCGIYTKALTSRQQSLLITDVNTRYKEPHTYANFVYTVTVSGGIYWMSGEGVAAEEQPLIIFTQGLYVFDQSHTSNAGNTLVFGQTLDATPFYTTNVATNGIAGSANACTVIDLSGQTLPSPALKYFSRQTAGMGHL